MKQAISIPLAALLVFVYGCAGKKLLEGQISYQKNILFSVYDADGAAALNEKVRDATLKIHYVRYSTDFGPDDVKVVESEGLPPCVYLGNMPLIYADAECARGYRMPAGRLAEQWAATLRKSIFAEKPDGPFPEKIDLIETGPRDPFEYARANRLPILIHIYADWCGACVRMEPELEAAQREMGDAAVFVMLNVDDPDASSLADKYSKGAYIPQNIFASPDGTVVKRVTGLMEKSDIVAGLKAAARK